MAGFAGQNGSSLALFIAIERMLSSFNLSVHSSSFLLAENANDDSLEQHNVKGRWDSMDQYKEIMQIDRRKGTRGLFLVSLSQLFQVE